MRRPAFAFLVAPAAVVLLVAAAAVADAESYTFRLDPATTRVTFVLDAFMHKVHGAATLVRGEIRFDGERGAAEGEVVVDAASLETGNEKRDRDMHVKVLESESFPEIVLVVDGYQGRFDPAGPSEVAVKGRLRIHGAEHPVSLELALKPEADSASGGDRLIATTTFGVPYVEWGMKDPSKTFLRVGKEVEVTIAAQGDLVAGD